MSLSQCQYSGGQFLRVCDATVKSCTPTPTVVVKAKGKKADATPVAQTYNVILSNTVLFPEGGGQPCDFGTLTSSDGTVARVLDVQRVDGVISHTVTAALEGPVHVEVDWERREDVMQQHSGQHLISAVFKRCFNVPTVSWSMAPSDYSYIELDPADMTALNLDALPLLPAHVQPQVDRAAALWASAQPGDMAAATEAVSLLVNALVRAAVEVRVHVWDSVAQAEQDPQYIEAVAANRAKAFPAGLQGPARCVEIMGLEHNTCCGTHVASLAQLQTVALKTERYKNNYKAYFVAGQRSLDSHLAMWAQQQTLVKLFTVPPAAVADAAEKAQAASRALSKRLDDAQKRLMQVLAAQLGASPAPVVAHLEPGAALPQLTLLGTAFTETFPGRTIVCAAADDQAQEGVFLVMGPADAVKKVGAAYAAVVEGRGGGRPGVYQGKAARMDLHDAAVEAAVAASQ